MAPINRAGAPRWMKRTISSFAAMPRDSRTTALVAQSPVFHTTPDRPGEPRVINWQQQTAENTWSRIGILHSRVYVETHTTRGDLSGCFLAFSIGAGPLHLQRRLTKASASRSFPEPLYSRNSHGRSRPWEFPHIATLKIASSSSGSMGSSRNSPQDRQLTISSAVNGLMQIHPRPAHGGKLVSSLRHHVAIEADVGVCEQTIQVRAMLAHDLQYLGKIRNRLPIRVELPARKAVVT